MANQYTASHKQWPHTGYIVPQVEHSASEYPSLELKVAPWLPVGREDSKLEHYFVLAAGKPVAVDRVGDAVPAGLKLAFQSAGGNTILTYDATDLAAGVIDLTTGVTLTSATSYTQSQVTDALRLRNLISASETARDFIGWPLGYAPYSYLQWAGGDGFNPTGYRQHNMNEQHQVAVGCDKALIVPMVPSAVATETQGDGNAIAGTAIVFGTGSWNSATGIAATTRYASDVSIGDDVVAMVFKETPVAKITLNTPITDSGSTLASMTEVDSIDAVKVGGSDYFFIDYEAGVLFLYESGGDAIPTGFSTSATITYYSYETAATGSVDIVQCLGDVKVGDFVTFDSTSNYLKWTPDIGTAYGGGSGAAYAADPEYDDQATNSIISAQIEASMAEMQGRVLGQVGAVWTWPRSGMEKVMTQYTALTAVDRMPGTATAGMSDALVQSGGANKVIVINFFSR